MATIGTLIVNVGARIAGFERDMNRAQQKLRGFGTTAQRVNAQVSAFASRAAGSLGAMLGVGSVAGAIGFGVKLAADMEQAEVAFTTMLGSAEKAKKILGDLQRFADITPFEFPELRDTARQLIAFGIGVDDVMEHIRRLGDISAGVSQPLNEVAAIYGKARVQGRLFAEDINQFTGRGIPIIGELAKQFGVADEAVRKLVETGQVRFEHLQRAFKALTDEGSKFGGLMGRQAETLSGKWSTFLDSFKGALRDLGTMISEELNFSGGLDSLTNFTSAIRNDLIPVLRPIVGVIGAIGSGIAEVFKVAQLIILDFATDFLKLERSIGSFGASIFGEGFFSNLERNADIWVKEFERKRNEVANPKAAEDAARAAGAADAAKPGLVPGDTGAIPGTDATKPKTAPRARELPGLAEAMERGSREALAAVAKAQLAQMRRPEDVNKQQLAEAKTQTGVLRDIARQAQAGQVATAKF